MQHVAPPPTPAAVDGHEADPLAAGRAFGIETRVEMVTRELAHAWLVNHPYARQRPLSEGQVQYLAETMRRGEFTSGEVEFRRLDGELFLVNGQHRLTAIDRTGLAQPMVIVTRDVADTDTLAAEYSRLDRNRQRGLADAYRAFGLEADFHLTKSDIRVLGSAVAVIRREFGVHHGAGYTSRSHEDRVGAMREWVEEMRTYVALIAGAQQSLVRRVRLGSVCGVALVTIRHRDVPARGFWRRVALNDGLRAGQPERALVEYFHALPAWGRPHEGLLERACARAWSAHLEGKRLDRIGLSDPSQSIHIAGTPFAADALP